MKFKYILFGFVTVLYILFLALSTYQIITSLDLFGKKLPPFLVTRQLGVDAIGLFLRTESFTKVFPQSYVKEVNGIPVKNDKEFYDLINSLDTNSVKVKFSNPFFFSEYEYVSEVSLQELSYLDFLVSFLTPVLFAIVLFSIAYYLSITYIRNLEILTKNRIRMLLSSILLFNVMGLLVITGLDLVNKKNFLVLLYLTFGTIGIVLSVFFYNLTYTRLKWWMYVIVGNIMLSFILLTGYIISFDNASILISFVKLNYLLIAMNVILGVIYLMLLRRVTNNIIEKERIKIVALTLVVPILILAIIFLIQGISIYTLPISIFFTFFVVVSPVIATVVNDHNVKLSKERIFFSIVMTVLILGVFFIISNSVSNVSQEQLFIFGIYGIPSILFLSLVIWYSVQNKLETRLDVSSIEFSPKTHNLKDYLLIKLMKRFNFINDVKIIFQYPIIYSEEGFETYKPHSEIWDSLGDKEVVSINDVFFDKRYSNFEKIFKTFNINYVIGFKMDNNKCMVGLNSMKVLKESDIDQIKMISESFMIDIQSSSLINSMKLVRVLNFEFELLRNSQINLLKTDKIMTLNLPDMKVNIINYWEPMVDLAGDIYGMVKTDNYFTYWMSDICGKGLNAAAISFTCYTLINQVIKNNLTIHKSAELINEILTNEPLFSVENFFLTLSGMTINTETSEAEIIRCGNPPIVFYDGKAVSELVIRGGLIGIFDNLDAEVLRMKLEKGMIFLIFSDGLTDIITPTDTKDFDQIQYIKSIVEQHKSPETIWNTITNNIFENSLNKRIIDDITLTMIYTD
ncbi:MAG: PP2C family protein-serine/threonine phosphatase [Spirochaetia bacterium]|nr:serine/threonine-protein phosphatase [Spirochaetota bacterium]MDW8112978.1 PP2C family protein-serine/threonine phosphatase [Spirochaetia bacterium]